MSKTPSLTPNQDNSHKTNSYEINNHRYQHTPITASISTWASHRKPKTSIRIQKTASNSEIQSPPPPKPLNLSPNLFVNLVGPRPQNPTKNENPPLHKHSTRTECVGCSLNATAKPELAWRMRMKRSSEWVRIGTTPPRLCALRGEAGTATPAAMGGPPNPTDGRKSYWSHGRG